MYMKTTIDIPDVELSETMRLLGVKTKREAVRRALNEFNSRHRMARLVRHSGTCDLPSNAEIESVERGEGKW